MKKKATPVSLALWSVWLHSLDVASVAEEELDEDDGSGGGDGDDEEEEEDSDDQQRERERERRAKRASKRLIGRLDLVVFMYPESIESSRDTLWFTVCLETMASFARALVSSHFLALQLRAVPRARFASGSTQASERGSGGQPK